MSQKIIGMKQRNVFRLIKINQYLHTFKMKFLIQRDEEGDDNNPLTSLEISILEGEVSFNFTFLFSFNIFLLSNLSLNTVCAFFNSIVSLLRKIIKCH